MNDDHHHRDDEQQRLHLKFLEVVDTLASLVGEQRRLPHDEGPDGRSRNPAVKDFVEANRQTGSTTTLVATALANNGYLIVMNTDTKNRLLQQQPRLDGLIYTLREIRDGKLRGLLPRQVFVDAAILCFF